MISSRSLTASKRDSMRGTRGMEPPQTPEMGLARNMFAVKKTNGDTFYGARNDTIQSIGSVQAHLKKHQ
jgi:hypothetical protein